MEAHRVNLSKGNKVGLITVGVVNIIIGLSSVGMSAATVGLTLSQYRTCYQYYIDSYYYDCNSSAPDYCFSYWLYKYSVTSQGIWTGSMVIISASLNIKLATNPTKQMGLFSGGFSILSFILTVLMIILESFPVSQRFYTSSSAIYQIWALHCALLVFAIVLFSLTLTNMIISYSVVGCYGCCCKPPVPNSNLYAVPDREPGVAARDQQTRVHNRFSSMQMNPTFHEDQTQPKTIVAPERPRNSVISVGMTKVVN